MTDSIKLASDSISIIQDMVEETDYDKPPSRDSLVKLADLLESLYEEVVELHNDLEESRDYSKSLEQEVGFLEADMEEAELGVEVEIGPGERRRPLCTVSLRRTQAYARHVMLSGPVL